MEEKRGRGGGERVALFLGHGSDARGRGGVEKRRGKGEETEREGRRRERKVRWGR